MIMTAFYSTPSCTFCKKIQKSYKKKQFVSGGMYTDFYMKDGQLIAKDNSNYPDDSEPYAVFELKHCPKCGKKVEPESQIDWSKD